jgi:hypothetical protein
MGKYRIRGDYHHLTMTNTLLPSTQLRRLYVVEQFLYSNSNSNSNSEISLTLVPPENENIV